MTEWIDFRDESNVEAYKHFRVLNKSLEHMTTGELADIICEQLCTSPYMTTDQKLGLRMIARHFHDFPPCESTVNYVLQFILYRTFAQIGATEATPMTNAQREAVLLATANAAKTVITAHIAALQAVVDLQLTIPIWRVPDAPSGLTATAISSERIDLSWTDNANSESSIVVASSLVQGGPYSDVATLDPNVQGWSNTGLTPNTTYYYVVRAVNSIGASSNSNEANATTTAE